MCPKPMKKISPSNNILPILLHRGIFWGFMAGSLLFDIFSMIEFKILFCQVGYILCYFQVTFSVYQFLLSLWLLIFVTSLHQQNQAAENKLQIRLPDMVMGFSLLTLNFLLQSFLLPEISFWSSNQKTLWCEWQLTTLKYKN